MSNPNHDAHKTAIAVAYFNAVLASGRANGISTGAYNARAALGVDPGTGQPGDT